MSLNTQQSLAVEEEDHDNLSEIIHYNTTKAAVIVRALNHKLRQLVIKTVHENKSLTVTQLFIRLRLEQSVASQHLAILRKASIVSTERDGKCIYYSINKERVAEIDSFAKEILNYQV
ncbi:MAG: metalloregulator ArsR/SmtB family transcription factor [Ginsengibacter sp.]